MRRAQTSRLARLRAHLAGASAGTEPGFAEKFSPEYMEQLAREAAERTEGSGSLEERVAVQWFGQKTPPGDGVGIARFSQRIRDLGLEGHIDELDEVGFTVIPPATLGLAPGLIERMRDGALRISEERSGIVPDYEGGTTHTDMTSGAGQHLFYVLFEDESFIEGLLNPVLRTCMSYMLGPECVLSSSTSFMRGPGDNFVGMHSDTGGRHPPQTPCAGCG